MKPHLSSTLYTLGLIFFLATQVSGQAVGSSRDSVTEALGQPTGTAKMGNREILSYGERRFILVDGVVTRIEENSPQAASNEATATNSSSTVTSNGVKTKERTARPITGWLTDYELAKKQAKLHNRPILILFTGSDWCPPCIAFQRNIASSPRFRKFASDNLILFKADFPRSYALPPAVKAQNEALAKKFGVRGFPTILAVEAKGKHLGTLDRAKANRGTDPVALHIEGIKEITGGIGSEITVKQITVGAVLLGLVLFIYRCIT
ncbi:MAG: thioredoxin fold domain-containing protein [Verrucomicrobia bacterium]|nr:thioredoxin fold domain-containing protein [Verrucomicrobiota bacterium]